MDMTAAATPLVAGLHSLRTARALCAILARFIHIHPIQAILHMAVDHTIAVAAAAVATIIISTADFTSHLVDDGANWL